MLPPEAIDTVNQIIDWAVEAAAAGRIGEGITRVCDAGTRLLSDGFQRALTLQELGQAGAVELVELWQQACDNYTASYRVPLSEEA
jgi:hypothetical protein